MKNSRPHLLFAALLLTVLGVVGGHYLGYRLLVPDHALRHQLLQTTGHQYFPYLVAAGVMLATGGLLLAFHAGRQPLMPRRPRFAAWQLALTLFVIQSCLFAAMEIWERHSSDAALSGLFQSSLVPLGILFQLLTAVLAVLVVQGAWAAGAVYRMARALPRPITRRVVGASLQVVSFEILAVYQSRAPPF